MDEVWDAPSTSAKEEEDGSVQLSGEEYRLGKRIAGGYQTDIYRAGKEDEETLRFVVKRLKPELARDPEVVERFKQEAWLTKQLKHPNIVRTIDFGESGNTYYMLMEAVHGRDLDVAINMLYDRGGRCPAGIGVEIITQVARALDYAHNAEDEEGKPINLVHRDISPTNVMLTWDGEVKLVDFGLAKVPEGRRKTESQSVVGKLTYQPPEALEGAKPNVQFDVYALGALLYELVAGRSPITGVWDLQTLVHKVKHEEPTPLNEIAADASDELTRVVHKAMAKDPADRYPTVAALLEDLEPIRSQYGTTEAVIEKFIGELFERPGYSFTGRYQVSFRTSEIKARKPKKPADGEEVGESDQPAAPRKSDRKKRTSVRTQRRGKKGKGKGKKKKKGRGGLVFFFMLVMVLAAAAAAWWFLGESGYPVPDPLGLNLWARPAAAPQPAPPAEPTPKPPEKALDVEGAPEGEGTEGEEGADPKEGEGDESADAKEGEGEGEEATAPKEGDAAKEGTEAAAEDTGTVRIKCRGKFSIYVDGKKKGRCPKLKLDLPAGSHQIEVRGKRKIRKKVEVKKGETVKVDASR